MPISYRAGSRCKRRLCLPPHIVLESDADERDVIRHSAILAAEAGLAAGSAAERFCGGSGSGRGGGEAAAAPAPPWWPEAVLQHPNGILQTGKCPARLPRRSCQRLRVLGSEPLCRTSGTEPPTRCRWCPPRQLPSSPVLSDWGSRDRSTSSC